MAQITTAPRPLATFVIRQDGVDLNSLLSAGLSLVSSILTPVTATSADDTPATTSTLATSVKRTASNTQSMSTPTSKQPTSAASSTTATSKSSLVNSATASPSQLKTVSSSTVSAASSTTAPKPSSHSDSKLPIILGVVLGIIILALLAVVLLFFHRHRLHRQGKSLFSRHSRTATPSSDGESDIIIPTTAFMAKDEDAGARYPQPQPLRSTHTMLNSSTSRHGSSGYAYVPPRDPFDDSNRYYDGGNGGNGGNGSPSSSSGNIRRSSRRCSSSSILDTVVEHPEIQPSMSDSGYGSPPPPLSPLSRSWSNGSNGNGFGGPMGVLPPMSPPRRNIPRKPVAPQMRMSGRPGLDRGPQSWGGTEMRLINGRSW